MQRFIYLSLFFLGFQIAYTQNGTQDSLKRLAQHADIPIQFEAYLKLAQIHQRTQPDSSHYFAGKAIKLAGKMNQPRKLAEILNLDAVTYCMRNQLDKGLQLFQRAYRIFDSLKLKDDLANVMTNLGNVYQGLDQYDSSIYYHIRSLKVVEHNNDTVSMIKSYHNIGNVYSMLGQHNKASTYYRKAIRLSEILQNEDLLMEVINNMGLEYRLQGKTDSALYCFNKYLTYVERHPNPLSLGIVFNNLGLVYQDKGDKKNAIGNYLKSIEFLRKIDHSWGIANACHNMAQVYLNAGMPDSSIVCSGIALAEIQGMGFPDLLRDIHYTLHEAYLMKNMNRKALGYFKDFVKYKDTVFSMQKAEMIANLEKKYETAKKEAENQALKSEMKLRKIRENRLMLITGGVVLLVFVLSIIVLLMRKTNRQKQKIAQQESFLLSERLEHSKRELASKALHLACQNEFRTKLLDTASDIYDHVDGKGKKYIKSLLYELGNNIDKNAWREFETRFEQVHESFIEKLHKKYPDLTPNDRRLCAFLKLNMTTKDIAILTHRSPRSVESARYRLRKKFGLEADKDISTYLQAI